MTIRRAAAVLASGILLPVACAGPALADGAPVEGAPTRTALEGVLFFAGIPIAVLAVIVLLVLAPSWTRAGRYRPGMGWFAEPVWVNGPDDDAQQALPSVVAGTTGGASARW